MSRHWCQAAVSFLDAQVEFMPRTYVRASNIWAPGSQSLMPVLSVTRTSHTVNG